MTGIGWLRPHNISQNTQKSKPGGLRKAFRQVSNPWIVNNHEKRL